MSPGGKAVSRSGVAEWEEPRHPGTASQEAKYPTTPHSATSNPHSVPLRLDADVKLRYFQDFSDESDPARFCTGRFIGSSCTPPCGFGGRGGAVGGTVWEEFDGGCRSPTEQ